MDRQATRQGKDRLDRIIGQNIRNERELRRMSREDLAEALDLTVSHMGLIERGERGATALTLSKIKTVMGIKIDNLFAEPERRRIALREGRIDPDEASRNKVRSLITRLNEGEAEYVSDAINGLIKLRPKDAPK